MKDFLVGSILLILLRPDWSMAKTEMDKYRKTLWPKRFLSGAANSKKRNNANSLIKCIVAAQYTNGNYIAYMENGECISVPFIQLSPNTAILTEDMAHCWMHEDIPRGCILESGAFAAHDKYWLENELVRHCENGILKPADFDALGFTLVRGRWMIGCHKYVKYSQAEQCCQDSLATIFIPKSSEDDLYLEQFRNSENIWYPLDDLYLEGMIQWSDGTGVTGTDEIRIPWKDPKGNTAANDCAILSKTKDVFLRWCNNTLRIMCARK